MPTEDVSFTFDTKQFEQGIGEVNKGMKGMKMGALKMAKGVALGMIAASAAIGVFKLAIKGARKLLNEMISGMPEIGQAFKIAKDIFFRNFLYPIRKAIMPFLQRMLDWVRDHRAMFVKWGHVVVGIFKTMLQMGRRVIDMFKRIWQGAARILSNIFGTEIKKVSDLMNIMAFKISATIQFISALLAPLFQTIGKIVETVAGFGVDLIKKFFSGFAEGAPGLVEQFKKVLEMVQKFFQALVDIDDRTGVFSTTLKLLGNIVGGVLMQAFLIIEGTIYGLIFALQSLVPTVGLVIQMLKPKKKRDQALIDKHTRELEINAEKAGEFYTDLGTRMGEAGLKTWEAMKGTFGANVMVQEKKTKQEQAPQTNIDVGTINVTAAEPDENKTKKVVEKVIDILQFQRNKEQETMGY